MSPVRGDTTSTTTSNPARPRKAEGNPALERTSMNWLRLNASNANQTNRYGSKHTVIARPYAINK
jgi:hypothetical protein